MKEKYCTTIYLKILIVQFILTFIGLTIGYMWELNLESENWSELIYSNIKIADIDLSGKTKEEARNIIKSQYIDTILNRKLYVTVADKDYAVNNSYLIKSHDMDDVIDEAFNFGRDLSIVEKHKLIKSASERRYAINFTCNDDFINTFINKIEKEINKEPVNAVLEMNVKGKTKIKPDIKGYKIEKTKLRKSIEDKIKAGVNRDIYIKAPVMNTEAEITLATLSPINTCISSFSTSFQSSSFTRTNNIEVCVKAINGKLLMPGEIFSFNEVLGERTKERGYMEAPIIIDNKVESGIGGGICQVSSTLYNAILKAGIQDIDRTNHSLPSSYVDLGLDATVDWGNIDFKFTNTLGYPVFIEGHTLNKKLYINIYSNSNLNKKKYIIESNINEDVNGYKVKVIRKTYESGMLVNSEFISSDIYANATAALKKRY